MNRILIAAASFAFASSAMADATPSPSEAVKLNEALAVLGCSGGKMEKETEATGVFEVDDSKCRDGQFDLKFDKDFKLLSMIRD